LSTGRAEHDLVVLQSFPVPRPTTNPYLVMLQDSLQAVAGVQVLNFSWRGALLGRYDVFHVHWPETLLEGHSLVKSLVREILAVLLLARLWLTRTPIVRTVHNIELPHDRPWHEILLLKAIDRWTTFRIRLNTATELPPAQPAVTIALGHYRDWFAGYPHRAVVPGQVGYMGLIRRYKGVENLIEAFRGTQPLMSGLTLRIGGKPSTPELAQALTALAGDDTRITLDFRFLSDSELVELVTSSQLVVLPYRAMHNSSSALAALSLGRPVLVPENAVNTALADEVGPGWLFCYRGTLGDEDIVRALTAIRDHPAPAQPDLSRREWAKAAAEHVAAFRAAVSARHGTL
jgi:beta-1,4-mannosyltransferase